MQARTHISALRSHTHANTCILICTCMHTRICTCTCTRAHTHTCMHTDTSHTCALTHLQCAHAHLQCACICTCTGKHKFKLPHACRHLCLFAQVPSLAQVQYARRSMVVNTASSADVCFFPVFYMLNIFVVVILFFS